MSAPAAPPSLVGCKVIATASCSSSVCSHDVSVATTLLRLITVVRASTLPSAPLPFEGWDGDESLSTSLPRCTSIAIKAARWCSFLLRLCRLLLRRWWWRSKPHLKLYASEAISALSIKGLGMFPYPIALVSHRNKSETREHRNMTKIDHQNNDQQGNMEHFGRRALTRRTQCIALGSFRPTLGNSPIHLLPSEMSVLRFSHRILVASHGTLSGPPLEAPPSGVSMPRWPLISLGRLPPPIQWYIPRFLAPCSITWRLGGGRGRPIFFAHANLMKTRP